MLKGEGNERLWMQKKWRWIIVLSSQQQEEVCVVSWVREGNTLQILSPPMLSGLHTSQTSMARMVALQQNQLSFSPLASSLSDFSGTRLHTQIQVLTHFTFSPSSFPSLSLYILHHDLCNNRLSFNSKFNPMWVWL